MHAQKQFARVFTFGSLLSLLLVGCAANVGKTIKVSDQQIAKYGTLTAEDALAELEKHVTEAMNANMPFLAPDFYRGASEILNDTRKSLAKKPKNELISDIAKADAILDKGQTMMAIVQNRLANELAMKIQLDKDNVSKVYPREYENVIGKLSSLIEKVELEKAGSLDKDKIELMKMMEALDIRAIQYTALHESETINEVTQSKDGEKQAPVTLAAALRIYKEAASRIAQAPHDEALVKSAGADALFAARHARYVNERVLALQIIVKEAVEPVVIDEEKRLLEISSALGYKDLRDQPVEKQAEEIVKVSAEILQGQQKTNQLIGAASDQSKSLEVRLKEANDAMQKSNERLAEKEVQLATKDSQLAERDAHVSDISAQIAEKDAQLKILNEQLAQLEEQNKSLIATKSAKPKGKSKAAANPKK